MTETEVRPRSGTPAVGAHVPALDGIRAVAALAVVLYHAQLGFGSGDLGVDMFFVLSGFLITGILLADASKGPIRYVRFYRRRALRLLPAYFSVLLACVALDRIWDVGGTLKGAVFSFFYVSNWAAASGTGLGSLAHTVLAGILYLTRRAVGATLIAVVACLAVAYGSVVLSFVLGAPWEFAWNSTLSRGTELLAGCLLAVIARSTPTGQRWPSRDARWIGTACVTCLIVLVGLCNIDFGAPWVTMLVRWPLVSLATMGLIAACVSGARLPQLLLGNPPVVAVGKVSYGLYLWHFPVFATVDSIWGLTDTPPRLLALAITAVIVPLSYRYIEQPFLRMKDRPAPQSRRQDHPGGRVAQAKSPGLRGRRGGGTGR